MILKILFVDTAIDGHHQEYLMALASLFKPSDLLVILPEPIECEYSQAIYHKGVARKRISDYFGLLQFVKQKAERFKPDIIHFLYGDYLYRFMGCGLGMLSEYNLICTFHAVRRSILHDISLRSIFRKINVGIVHTNTLKAELNGLGIKNVRRITYPCFAPKTISDTRQCKRALGLDPNIPVLGVIGNTRYDKGLDILLEALNHVSGRFQLLIAGKEEHFSKQYVMEKTKRYFDKVRLLMHYLSDEELHTCLQAIDILVLPYRKTFNGASGPLAEACFRQKRIIAPSHGSLEELTTGHGVGRVFQSENAKSLSDAIENELAEYPIPYDHRAIAYADRLKPELFALEYERLYRDILR